MVEVLVAGGGPAGAAAAIVLARRGVRVLLVERGHGPRVAREGVSLDPLAVAELHRLDLGAAMAPGAHEIRGVRVTASGVVAAADYPGGQAGWGVSRADLDAALLEAARRAGAQVQLGVDATGLLVEGEAVRGAVLDVGRRKVRVPAVVTIAADGHDSVLAREAGLVLHPRRRRAAVTALVEGLDLPESRRDVRLGRGWWLALTPLTGGVVAVTVVGVPTRDELPAEVWLRDTLASSPGGLARGTQVRLTGPIETREALEVDESPAGALGLLLAGDAAGAADPAAADGVWLALRGGGLAAEVALAVLEQPALRGHLELARRRSETFRQARRRARRLRALFAAHDTLPARSVWAIGVPLIARALAGPPSPGRGDGVESEGPFPGARPTPTPQDRS